MITGSKPLLVGVPLSMTGFAPFPGGMPPALAAFFNRDILARKARNLDL
jgi:hypothetical protein